MEFYSKPLLQDHVMPFSSLKSLEHVGSQPIKVDINFISCVLCYVYTQHRNPRIIYIYIDIIPIDIDIDIFNTYLCS